MLTAKENRRSDNEQQQILCTVAVPSPVVYSPLPLRFLARVEFRADGCWQWVGGVRHKKYGGYPAYNLHTDSSKDIRAAHRFSYEAHNGPIPEGLEIDHLCCNKLCVNPEHLEAVTHKENMRRYSYRRRAGKAGR